MPFNKHAILDLDLPFGADVAGAAIPPPFIRKERLPERLKEVPGKILQGFSEGTRLFILNVQGETPKFRTYWGNTGSERKEVVSDTPHNNALMAQDADVYQLVLRLMAKDPRFSKLLLISPDDRETIEKAVVRYMNFVDRAVTVEEKTRDVQGLIADPTKQGIILVLTPAIKALIGKELGQKMISKVLRIFDGKQLGIAIDPASENPYEKWEKHIMTASTTKFRELLVEALKDPDTRDEKVARASLSFTREFQTGQEGQEAVLRRLQGLVALPYNVFMFGDYGVGKTTLMQGVHQLAKQAGYPTMYQHWELGLATAKDFIEHSARRENMFISIDQVDRGTSLDPCLYRRPEIMRGQRIAGPRSRRIVMTSNLTPEKLIDVVSDEKHFPGSVHSSTGEHGSNPVNTLFGGREWKFARPGDASPQTYQDFISRTYAVQLGGVDWSTRNNRGLEITW